MNIVAWLQRCASYICPQKVEYRSTINPDITFTKEEVIAQIQKLPLYQLKSNLGVFDLIKITPHAQELMYDIYHVESGRSFRAPQWLFTLLFEESTQKIDPEQFLKGPRHD